MSFMAYQALRFDSNLIQVLNARYWYKQMVCYFQKEITWQFSLFIMSLYENISNNLYKFGC